MPSVRAAGEKENGSGTAIVVAEYRAEEGSR
jgi:hypothetical protein